MKTNLDPRPGDPFPLTTHLLQKITELERENAALRADKERLDWLEHFIISFSRLTAPDMGGACFVGQYCNSSKDLGKSRQSYLKMEGSTIRAAIDAARKEQP